MISWHKKCFARGYDEEKILSVVFMRDRFRDG